MRLIGVLIGPALLAVLLMEAVPMGLGPPSKEPVVNPRGILWAGRVFTSERQFTRWLEVRGRSYEEWRRRHPNVPWPDASERSLSATRQEPSDSGARLGVVAAVALASVVGVVGVGGISRRRRRRLLERPLADGPGRAERRALSGFALLAVGFALCVRRGAVVLWAVLSAAAPALWRVLRRGVAALLRGVARLRVGTPVAARAVRRGATQAVGAADDLYEQVQRTGETRVLRTVLGYGAVTMASGALGVAIAIVLS